MTFWIIISSFTLLSFYFLRRDNKVLKLRLEIIDFVYSGDYKEVYDKKVWFDKKLPSYKKMCWSFKPLSSFIVGEYAESYLQYSKNKINGN